MSTVATATGLAAAVCTTTANLHASMLIRLRAKGAAAQNHLPPPWGGCQS